LNKKAVENGYMTNNDLEKLRLKIGEISGMLMALRASLRRSR
jgi:hypothetical protein